MGDVFRPFCAPYMTLRDGYETRRDEAGEQNEGKQTKNAPRLARQLVAQTKNRIAPDD